MKICQILHNLNITMNKNPTFSNKKYDYVRTFEIDDRIIPSCYIVCRIDGKNFHKFSNLHAYQKPNDLNAIKLMNYCALEVMKAYKDILLAYGQSDEYSFIFNKDTSYVGRRASKIISHVVSLFSSAFVANWGTVFTNQETFNISKLKSLPVFDGRVVAYPNEKCLQDYINWRQVDCHVNNLYNTTFWSIVNRENKTPQQAQTELAGTFSADKNEILFARFGLNYNNEPQIYRKGTLLVRESQLSTNYRDWLKSPQNTSRGAGKNKSFDFYTLSGYTDGNCKSTNEDYTAELKGIHHLAFENCDNQPYLALHLDLINGDFWTRNPSILSQGRDTN